MICKNRFATVAMPPMIAILLLLAASSRVSANDRPLKDQPLSNQPSPANGAVKIDNFSFGPQTLKVPVGATVTWTIGGDIPRTAVSTEGAFKSKGMDTDEKFPYTFDKPETYP